MKCTRLNNIDEAAQHVAGIICDTVKQNKHSFMLLATGASPTKAFEEVTKQIRQQQLDFSSVRIHKLDEFMGLGANDHSSCQYYLQSHVIEPWGITQSNYTGIDATSTDLASECQKAREVFTKVGPADLCVLGLGMNGHIGFNEPGDHSILYTSIVPLHPLSQVHPMIAGQTINEGITSGMAEIMQSKKIVMIVTGEKKKALVEQLMNSLITTQFPASLLKLHPNFELVIDATVA